MSRGGLAGGIGDSRGKGHRDKEGRHKTGGRQELEGTSCKGEEEGEDGRQKGPEHWI